ncbi:MAG: class I SAM-dependent methyltransferase, partial [Pseudolabrys sp.]
MSKLADQIIGHYERHAIAWDGDRTHAAWNDKPWHDRFIGSLPKGATVLDLGCGSGSPVARHMAANGLKITGVDSSPTFISLCRSRLPGHTWLVGNMRSPPLKPKFQGIPAWDCFFHLKPADQRK